MQLKEPSLEQFYSDYLVQYSSSRREGATPDCMHPADIPTIVFIVDTLIQLCSLPVSGGWWVVSGEWWVVDGGWWVVSGGW